MDLNILQGLLDDTSSQYHDCGLVITGHSLGAGVAALMTCLLKPNFPNICCYSYCPPGSLVSSNLAEYLEKFCTSIVVGDDFVPRASRQSARLFKNDIKRIISSCDQHKRHIIGAAVKSHIPLPFSSKKQKDERQGILHRKTNDGKLRQEDVELLKRQSSEFRIGIDEFPPPDLDGPPMYMPGLILYFEKIRRPPLKVNYNAFKKLVKRKNSQAIPESAVMDSELKSFNVDAGMNADKVDEVILMPPSQQKRRQTLLSTPQYLPSQQKCFKKKCSNEKEEADEKLQEEDVDASKSGFLRPGKYLYVPRYGSKEEFKEIVISRTMLIDHSPFELFKKIQKLGKGSILGALFNN
jgi:hypothetical protein